MYNIFLVFGYGIPKNILKDESYHFYLKMVFNKVYEIVVHTNTKIQPLIICCGGNTDLHKPYTRNEADEMLRLFTTLMKQRPFLAPLTKNWLFIPEKESLSTLENLLNSKKIIEKRKIDQANIFIFCEYTRAQRITILAKKIFKTPHNLRIIPIDFDTSANRYLSPDFLAKKEKTELGYSLWALQSKENLQKHHEFSIKKIAHLRKAGPHIHVEAVQTWWEKQLKEIKK